jgi:hypothetical protein
MRMSCSRHTIGVVISSSLVTLVPTSRLPDLPLSFHDTSRYYSHSYEHSEWIVMLLKGMT